MFDDGEHAEHPASAGRTECRSSGSPADTEDEKIEIASATSCPSRRMRMGLENGEWVVEDDALLEIIRRYMRVAGVQSRSARSPSSRARR